MCLIAMSFVAQAVPWDFFQNFCIVMGCTSVVFIAGVTCTRWVKQEFAEKERVIDLEKQFERELESLKQAYEIRAVADAARFEKLEKDYDETIRLLSISRMLQPGSQITKHPHK